MKLIKEKHADFYAYIIDVCRGLGYRAEPYSGRGMFGKHCISVTLPDDNEIFRLGSGLRTYGYEGTLPHLKTDGMAGEIVAYWPEVEVEEEDSDLGDGEE